MNQKIRQILLKDIRYLLSNIVLFILVIFFYSDSSIAESLTNNKVDIYEGEVTEFNGDLKKELTEIEEILNHGKREELFPFPDKLKKRVDFWIKIFTIYDTKQVVIHDSRHLDIIYEIVDIKDKRGYKNNRAIRKKYKNILRSLHKKRRRGFKMLTPTEKRVYDLFREIKEKNKFLIASRRVRSQLGQKDRFKEGLIKSGRYIDRMRQIFREHGLPEELTVLPYVESSFQLNAYSKAGAAGIWQFMPGTGRRFLKINYVVDERWDPIISTIAAAKYLKKTYEELNSWPLTITAYNYGTSGMKRAQRIIGDEIDEIIDEYNTRRFGFASKNFYAEFLAALDITGNYKRYYGDIEMERPVEFETYRLPDFMRMSTIARYLNIDVKDISYLNSALRRPVLSSQRYIPKGYELRLPMGKVKELALVYNEIPPDEKFKTQKRSMWYKVRRGDNLSKIALRYSVSIDNIMRLNNMSDDIIYPGQVLQILTPRDRAKGKRDNRITAKRDKDDKREDNKGSKEQKIGIIRVETDETLWHYSNWSRVSLRKIRKLNNMGRRNRIKAGQKIKIPFYLVTEEEFNEKRLEYQKGIEEDFFASYIVDNTVEVSIKQGENVWSICNIETPCWLLKRYNPDKDLNKVGENEIIIIPVVSKREKEKG